MAPLIRSRSRPAAGRLFRDATTAALVPTAAPAPPPSAPAPRRFTAAEYFRLAETGVLAAHERVELLAGTIYTMAPQGDAHITKTDRLLRLFTRPELIGAPDRWIVRCQSTLRLGPASAPEPDLALLRYRADFYAGGGPKPADVLLVVEVADSSLGHDRTLKAAEYARAGIVEYWILNVPEARVEVHRRPVRRSGRYREVQSAAAGQTLPLAAFPAAVTVAVADLLAPLPAPAPAPAPRRGPARRRRPAGGDRA